MATTALAGLCGASLAGAQALPAGGSVASGRATISASGSTLTINQTSKTAITNWQSFSVGQGDRVVINQPDVGSDLLARVNGAATSVIAGQISATGQFFLVNPNGVFITPSGVVNAGGGFAASTLTISDADFKAGSFTFLGKGASAGVTNQGMVTIGRGGYAALIGGTITNSGLIAVPMGRVALGSGEAATLDLSGDGFLQVAVPTRGGDGPQALIQSSGSIRADGGLVVMDAATARTAARQAINISGDVEAHSISGQSGSVVLDGGTGGAVQISGSISVTGEANDVGGSVAVTGQTLTLAGAKIDASGGLGGGAIKIGGDNHGAGTMLQADSLSMDAETTLAANATGVGAGGDIVLWSTGQTNVSGQISAQGGPRGGNGGSIETSGHGLDFTGALVDASAAKGAAGTWLLDPYNLTIGATDASTISNDLSGGTNVTLTTTSSAASSSPTGIGVSSSGNGDIIINSAITWGSAATLTLSAYHSIAIDAGITISGAGGLSVTTNNGGNGGGLTFGTGIGTAGSVAFTDVGDSGRSLRINGISYQFIDTMAELAAINGSSGNYALAQPLSSSTTYTSAVAASFSGTLEGLGNTISNLTISNSSGNAQLGLIGQLNSGGVIRDLGLTGGSITGTGSQNYAMGDLVGVNYGTILQSYATGNITITAADSGDYIGGLVGANQYGASITASYATGNVGDNNNGVAGGQIGGLVGANGGAIAQSFATGWVSDKDNGLGGLVGFMSSNSGTQLATITNSYATGAVTSANGNGAGGLVGNNAGGQITNSYAVGTIGSTNAAGLVWSNYNNNGAVGTITNSYWDETSSGVSSGANGTGSNTATMQTASFAATLGSAFGGGSGIYPYLKSINPSGVQVIAGTIFKGADVNPVATSTSGAGTAAIFVNGIAFGSASTNGSGAYRFQAPAGTVSAGTSLLVTATQNSLTGEINGGNLNSTGATGMDVYGGYFYDNTSQTSYSASNVATVLGYASTPSALASLPFEINASGASYTFDTALTLSKNLTLNVNSGEPITVAAPITLTGSNTLTLGSTSSGALTINAPIAATGAGVINLSAGNLSYSSSGGVTVTPMNMSFGGGGSVQFQDGGLGALTLNGTSYTLIDTMAQLANINTSGLGGHYALAIPLTASTTYTAALIGSSGSPFTGAFEGLGNSITGLTINPSSTTNYVGLFGAVSGASAVVRDLNLVGGGVSGNQTVGFLAGYNNQGLIFQVSETGGVTATADSVGGLIGTNSGFIVNSHATGAVTGNGTTGGLVGHNSLNGGAEDGLITGSYATGNVTVTGGGGNVGGLVGGNEMAIINAYATGTISASSSTDVGGLVGSNFYSSGSSAGSNPAPITNAYATGSVTGATSVGGLAGYNYATNVLNGVSASGSVTSTATNSTNIGGLAGYSAGVIQNASASGAVSMPGTTSGGNFVGGLVGDLVGSITKSYATGAVAGGTAINIGGLVGRNESTGTITQSFATGAITLGANSGAGGLVGDNYGSITQSYAMGSVTGTTGVNIGGIAGQIQSGSVVSYSYATGALTGQSGSTFGGVYGALAGGATLTGNYWDTTTTGVSAAQTGGTGLATAALQGTGSAALTGLNGGGSVFSSGAGLYPYLEPIYTSGVEVVSGLVYRNAGQTLLTPTSSGAGQVSLNIGGVSEGSVSVGANGYYYFLLAPGAFASGATVVPYTTANSSVGELNGAAFATAAGTSVTGLNVYGGYLSYSTSATNYSSALPSFTTNQSTLATYLGGTTLSSTLSPYMIATGSGFTIDQTPTVNSLAVQTTATNAGITVASAAPITISGPNTLTLDSVGALNIDAAVTVKGAGTVNLTYNTASATNFGFGIGDPLVYQTSLGAAATSSQGGSLNINSQVYSLLYSMSDVAGVSGGSGHYALATSLNASGSSYTSAVVSTFSGTFEGLGNTVSDLTIAGGGSSDIGLFGYNTGNIRDIGLLGGAIGGGGDVGALAGVSSGGALTNVYSTASVTARSSAAGGLVGDLVSGALTDAFATGSVTGASNYVGGLVGMTGANGIAISNVYATGAVKGANYVGGLLGISYATVTDAYATGAVLLSGGGIAGGVAATSNGSMTNVYWDETTSGRTTGVVSGYGSGSATGLATAGSGGLQTGGAIASLGSAFAGGAGGLYPYLVSFYPNGVQAVSGIAYKTAGASAPLASTTSGAGLVSLASGGAILATSTTGANGYYYIAVPNGTLASNQGLVAYTASANGDGAADAASFTTSAAAAGVAASSLNIYGGWLTQQTGNAITTLSGLNSAYSTTIGSTTPSTFTFANREIDVGGSSFAIDAATTLTGTLALSSSVNVTQSASVNVGSLLLLGTGDYTLNNSGNQIATVAASAGALSLADDTDLSVGTASNAENASTSGMTSTAAVNLAVTGGLTLTSAVTAGSGADATLSATGAFTNAVGSGAIITSGGGRWLVYSANPSGDAFDSLDSANTAVWNTAPGASVTATGDRYVFAYQPSLIVTTQNDTKTYGQSSTVNGLSNDYAITGEPAVTGAYLGDTTGLYAGAPAITSGGSGTLANVQSGGYVINAAIGSLSVTAAGYSATPTYVDTGVLTVTPLPVTLTGSRVYDGSTTIALSNLTLTDGVGGATVTTLGLTGSGSVASPNVSAGNQALSLTGFSLANTNYTLTGGSGTATITALPVTLSGTQVYSGSTTAPGSNLAVTNLVSGDSVTVGGTGTMAAKDVVPGGSEALTSLTGLTLNNGNYTLIGGSGAVTVTPAALSIVAANQTATYGAPYSLTGYTASGLQGSDAVTGISETITVGGQTLGATTAHTPAAGYAITPSAVQGLNANNYTITYDPSGTLTVNPLAVTLSGTQVYSGSTTALGSNLAVTNLVSGDSVTVGGTGTMAAKDVVPGGSEALTSLTGLTLNNGNYTLVGGSGAVTVTPAALSIVAANQTATYGAPYSLTGYTASGLQGSDAVTGISETITVGGQTLGATTAHTPAAGYAITPSAVQGLNANNYTITYDPSGTLTVNPLAVTLSGTQVYSGSTTALGSNLAVTNLVSGDSVTVGGTGTMAAKDVVPSGTEALTSLAGLTLNNGNYTLVGGSGAVTVTPAALSIVAANQTATYGAPYSLTGYTASGLQGSDAVTGISETITVGGQTLGATTAHTPAAGYAITPSAVQGLNANNYTVTYDPSGTLTVNPLAVTLSGTQVYSGSTTALGSNLAVTNLVSGDSVTVGGTGTMAAKDVVPGGTEALTSLAGLTLNNGNYTLIGGSGAVTVTPAALSIVAANQTATYGAPYSLTGYTASGLQGSDAVTGISETITVGGQTLGATTAHTPAAGYAITPSAVQGLNANNYTITYDPSGTLTVNPLAVTLSGTQVYSGSTTALGSNLAVTNLVSGDSVTVGGTGTMAAKDVVPGGTEALTSLAGLTLNNGNYTLIGGSGAVTVTPAALSIVAANQTATYGAPYSLTGYTASGLQGSDAVTGISETITVGGQTLGATTAHTPAAGYAITPSAVQGLNANNYTITYDPSGTLTVNPLAVTLSGTQVYSGSTTALGSNLAVTNLVSGDSVTVGGTGTMAAKDVVPGGTEALTSLTGLTLNNGNYTLVGGSGAVTVTPAALKVTGATGVNKTFDGGVALPSGATGFVYSGVLGEDAVIVTAANASYASASAGPETINVSGMMLSGPAAIDYSLSSTSVTGSGTITLSSSGSTNVFIPTITASAPNTGGASAAAGGNSNTLGGLGAIPSGVGSPTDEASSTARGAGGTGSEGASSATSSATVDSDPGTTTVASAASSGASDGTASGGGASNSISDATTEAGSGTSTSASAANSAASGGTASGGGASNSIGDATTEAGSGTSTSASAATSGASGGTASGGGASNSISGATTDAGSGTTTSASAANSGASGGTASGGGASNSISDATSDAGSGTTTVASAAGSGAAGRTANFGGGGSSSKGGPTNAGGPGTTAPATGANSGGASQTAASFIAGAGTTGPTNGAASGSALVIPNLVGAANAVGSIGASSAGASSTTLGAGPVTPSGLSEANTSIAVETHGAGAEPARTNGNTLPSASSPPGGSDGAVVSGTAGLIAAGKTGPSNANDVNGGNASAVGAPPTAELSPNNALSGPGMRLGCGRSGDDHSCDHTHKRAKRRGHGRIRAASARAHLNGPIPMGGSPGDRRVAVHP